MTLNGFLQIALYFVVLIALAKPLGSYMARVYENKPVLLARVLGPLERLIYRVCGVKPEEEMRWTTYAIAVLLFSAAQPAGRLRPAAAAGVLAAQPAGVRRRVAGPVVQHRRQLRHQHQLAGLRRRDDHELPDPDAGPDRAELRLGRRRHGDPGGFHPRASPATPPRPSATSGST